MTLIPLRSCPPAPSDSQPVLPRIIPDRPVFPRLLHRLSGCVLLAAAVLTGGCVSSQLQLAGKKASPPPRLDLQARTPTLEVGIHGLIVPGGAGSWKERAFWDEYLVVVANPTQSPVRILSAELIDDDGTSVRSADDWMKLEAESASWWKRNATARNVALAGGYTTLVAGGAVGGLVLVAGSLTAAPLLLPAAGAVLLSSASVGTVKRAESTQVSVIRNEFDRRRLALPHPLAAGAASSGSLFFRLTASPRTLLITHVIGQRIRHTTLDLAPLAQLHRREAGASPETPATANRAAANTAPTDLSGTWRLDRLIFRGAGTDLHFSSRIELEESAGQLSGTMDWGRGRSRVTGERQGRTVRIVRADPSPVAGVVTVFTGTISEKGDVIEGEFANETTRPSGTGARGTWSAIRVRQP